MSEAIVPRKSRRTGFYRVVRKYTREVLSYVIPTAKFLIMPGLVYYSIYHTEPQPTIFNLFNPFY